MAQVINIGKYKKHNEINAVAKHNLRCYIPKNVDEDRQKDNIFFVGKQGQRGISRIVTEKLKDIPHRKDANKVVNLVFSASKNEFDAMGEAKAKQWATEMHNYCARKFGKENILYSVLHNDETTKHLHFSFIPLRENKLQSNFWFDGPAKLQKFRKEVYAINRKYGIAPDDPPAKEDKADRTEINEFYAKVKRSEKIDDVIDAEIEKVKDLSSFTLNPAAKITKLTSTIKSITDYATTATVRIKKYKASNKKLRKSNDEFQEKIKKQEDELNRFAEVDNLKKLSYAELNDVNSYVNSKYSETIKQRESKEKKPLTTPTLTVSQQEKPIDKKMKIS